MGQQRFAKCMPQTFCSACATNTARVRGTGMRTSMHMCLFPLMLPRHHRDLLPGGGPDLAYERPCKAIAHLGDFDALPTRVVLLAHAAKHGAP